MADPASSSFSRNRLPLRWQLALLVGAALLPAMLVLGLEAHYRRSEAALRLARSQTDQIDLLEHQLGFTIAAADQVLLALTGHPALRQQDPAASAMLAELKVRNEAFASLVAVSAEGALFASAPAAAGGVQADDRRWFREAIARRDLVAGEVVLSRTAKRPSWHLARPILDQDRVVAVVAVALDAEHLASRLTSRLSGAGTITITDHRGTILWRSGQPGDTGKLDEPATIEPMERPTGGPVVIGDQLVSWRSLSLRPDGPVELQIRLSLPVATLRHEADGARHLDLGLAALAAVLAVVAVWWFARRRIAAPLEQAVAAAESLARGEVGRRVTDGAAIAVASQGEIGRLGTALQTLADELARREDARQRHLAELAASEAHFRLLAENTNDIISLHEVDGTFRYVSPAAERVLGQPPTQLQGQSLWSLMEPEDAQRLRHDGLRRVLSGEAVVDLVRLRHRDGSWIRFEAQVQAVLGPGGRPTGLQGAWRPAGDRQRAEDELHRVRAQLGAILDGLPFMAWLKDRDGRFLVVNEAFTRTAARPAEEIIGRSDAELWPRELAERYRAEDAQVAVARARLTVEEPVSIAGRTTWYETTRAPVLGPTGEVVGIAGLARDISERKRNQAQLDQVREAAEAGDRAKSAFLTNMSHEIRTPLNGVLGLTELLLRTELSGIQRDHALAIQRSGEALLGIINDVIDYAKIEANRLDLEHQPFDLLALAHDAIDQFRGRADDLELLVSLKDRTPTRVQGDATRLRQVLVSLVGNAVRGTTDGHVLLRIDGTRDAEGTRASIRLSVEDTGIGLAADHLPGLFQPFMPVDSTARRHAASGLGLTITRRLVELMGGRIEAFSAPGKGTTITIELEFELDSSSASVLEPASMRGRRVLVVDQHPLLRQVLGEQLTSLGCEVVAAADAAEGVQAVKDAEAQPFAIAILGRGGDSPVCRAAADQLADRRELPLIRLVQGDGGPLSGPGAELTVVKPVRPEGLARALRKALRAGSGGSGQKGSSSGRLAVDPTTGRTPLTLTALTVLLVEDNPVNRQVASGMLELLGVQVVVAETGREALERLATTAVQAILMDCQMPDLDGYAATAAIRARERETGAPRVPIIALTANALAGDRERCLEAGMDDYLAKPVAVDRLRQVLERWTRRKASGPQRATTLPETVTPVTMLQRTATPQSGSRVFRSNLLDQVLNPERLAPLRAALKTDDQQLKQTLLLPFLADARRYAEACHQAATAGNLDAMVRPAHTLKGSSLTVGAEALGAAAARLVALGRNRSSDGLGEALAELDRELNRLAEALA